MNTTLNIGLAGLGTVGGGLVRLLSENAEEIRARSGCDFNLKAVAVRNPNRKRDLPEGVRLTTDPMTLADDPDIDVVIELMGGIDTAKELITRSLAKGKQVVTANKALLAEEGESLFRLADEKGATLLYEASVAGGIPIVQTLKESLTGNHITSLEGILNGTGNYILSEMTSKGVNFAPALAEAQEKGYAEADPTLDIDGFDTAHKLVLLIRLAWGVDYPYTKMPIEGIRNLDKMDIDFAREFGYRIKLLGRARMRDGKLEAGVFPTLVNHTYLLARVGGAYNAVRVEGNAVGSLFLHGLGAGSLPTASAVLGDLISIARQNNKLNSGFVKQVLPQADILPPEEACNTYYMRFMVKDDPGVLRDLSGAQAAVRGESDVLLRTQTSGVQVHAMEDNELPIYVIAPGKVYRRDVADPSHLPQFTQIEGLVVDEGITFGDLKGTLDYLCKQMFGEERKTRFRAHYFPFTEPSAEVDVSCGICHGEGCRFCKGTGWLEILGCGMVDPNVLSMSGIDPEKYSGFAFGMGVERIACLKYNVPDLRMLVEGDMRFLRQF